MPAPTPRDDAALVACADPNNLPFTNARREGFENRIAEIVARDLRRPLEYYWQPQRRGFMRTTIQAHRCDLLLSAPASMDRVRTTRPYYRSSYVFVTQRGRRLDIRSFDDPRLPRLEIGIQIVGEDYDNPPPAQALADRQVFGRVHGFTVYGDYSQPAPQRAIVDAVAAGTVDVAVVWGPIAGYFAAAERVPLRLSAVQPNPRVDRLPFAFDISMAVRADDPALFDAVDAALARRDAEIQQVLREYHVPVVDRKG